MSMAMRQKEGGYVFKTDTVKKEVRSILSGQAESPEEVQQFIASYQEVVSAVNAKEYTLVLDCRAMTLIYADMMGELEKCMHMYKASGFKAHRLILNDNPVLRKQIERAVRRSGLPNVEWA